MNKLILLTSSLLIAFPKVSFSEQVTINISASVIERSCTISNDSLNSTITLQAGDLRGSKVGIPFSATPFSISLIDCPDNISTAHITFTGDSDKTMANLLKNADETDTGAKGIALGLYDLNNNNIDISNNKTTLTINHTLSKNTFNFLAYYVKVNSIASAGKIISVADFELAYD